ncbi:Type IV leader peptidase family protein [Tranquillimonas alkanivorans]|uniref:Type IV leader peptidase family protein n=2 Tax=Tranquillimonas alkanivorans TaxID=441119 RepID=A0A1I5TTL1_9RHOB|nr:Type IV leader peptidase family protein [Tranquillimonas alkanivorans]
MPLFGWETVLISEILLVLVSLAVSLTVAYEDIRHCEIDARTVIGLSCLLVLLGVGFGLPQASAIEQMAGAAVGVALGAFGRLYSRWRFGAAAFGGADVALMIGFGAALGWMAVAPWILAACVLAAASYALPAGWPLAARRMEVDGEVLRVLPFCPALLAAGWTTWFLLRVGVV